MPSQTFNINDIADLRNAAGQGITSAIFRAATDFLFGNGKPWYYYAGAAIGATAAATGIDGATATVFVLANTVEAYVLKSPNGGEIRVFLDGVQQGVIDLEASEEVWELVQLVVDPAGTIFRRVDLQAIAVGGAVWMGLGQVILTRNLEQPQAQEKTTIMPYDTLAFRLRDAEANTTEATLPIYIPAGATLANLAIYSAAIGAEIDALTESQITNVLVTLSLGAPAGAKGAPLAGAFNERGGLITFDTTGPRADSVRIPAIRKTIMPGDDFSLADAAVAALITRLTTASTAANIRPRTVQDYEFEVARKGTKSLRK